MGLKHQSIYYQNKQIYIVVKRVRETNLTKEREDEKN